MTDFYDLFNTLWMAQKEDEVSFRIVNIITYPKKSLMRWKKDNMAQFVINSALSMILGIMREVWDQSVEV